MTRTQARTENLDLFREVLHEAFAPVDGETESPYTAASARDADLSGLRDLYASALGLREISPSRPRVWAGVPRLAASSPWVSSEALREGRDAALSVELPLGPREGSASRLPPETERSRAWSRARHRHEQGERREAVSRRRRAREDAAFVDRLIAGGAPAVTRGVSRRHESSSAVEALLGGARATVDEVQLDRLMRASCSAHPSRVHHGAATAPQPSLEYAMSFHGWEGHREHLGVRES